MVRSLYVRSGLWAAAAVVSGLLGGASAQALPVQPHQADVAIAADRSAGGAEQVQYRRWDDERDWDRRRAYRHWQRERDYRAWERERNWRRWDRHSPRRDWERRNFY